MLEYYLLVLSPSKAENMTERERERTTNDVFSFERERLAREAKNLKNEISSMALANRIRTLACTYIDTCALILFLNLSAKIERTRKTTLTIKKEENRKHTDISQSYIDTSHFSFSTYLAQLFIHNIQNRITYEHTIE